MSQPTWKELFFRANHCSRVKNRPEGNYSNEHSSETVHSCWIMENVDKALGAVAELIECPSFYFPFQLLVDPVYVSATTS